MPRPTRIKRMVSKLAGSTFQHLPKRMSGSSDFVLSLVEFLEDYPSNSVVRGTQTPDSYQEVFHAFWGASAVSSRISDLPLPASYRMSLAAMPRNRLKLVHTWPFLHIHQRHWFYQARLWPLKSGETTIRRHAPLLDNNG